MTDPQPAGTDRTEAASANRPFNLLWLGEGTSLVGSMTTTLVLPLLAVTQLHAGALAMGVLSAAAWFPWIVGGLHVGAMIDRQDARRPMIAVDLVTAAALASVPIAQALGHLGLAQVLLVAFVTGCSSLVVRTGMGVLIPQLVPRERLEQANARIFGTESAAQVLGPGVGGLLVTALGTGGALGLDAASCLVSALCLYLIGVGRGAGEPSPRPDAPTSRGGVLEGARITWRDRYLRFSLVTGSLSNLGLSGYAALLVLFLSRDLGLSAARIGALEAIGAVGGLLGAVVAPGVGRRVGIARGTVVLGVLGGAPALLVPLAAPGWRVWLVPAGSALVGLGVVGGNVLRSGFRQRWVPSDLLGRVAGATGVVMMGAMALGGLVAGWSGARLGVVPTMLGLAALHALTSIVLLTPLCPFARDRDFPSGTLTAR